MRRSAFTLIELLISITILSIIMVFLYQSYATLNKSNKIFKQELELIENLRLKRKMIFLDLSIAKQKINIKHESIDIDTLLFQSSNSVHARFNPYIAYIVNQNKLYRLESLKLLTYPLDMNSEFDVDFLGEVSRFKVFVNRKENTYIVDIVFVNKQNILLKVKVLNEI